MKLLQKILDKLNGLYYSQEYLCLAPGSVSDTPHVYLVSNTKIIKDITNHHLFVGYNPLIFALPSLDEIDLSLAETVTVVLSQAVLSSNESLNDKDALGIIRFKKMDKKFRGNDKVYFYEGQHASHHLLNPFHQYIIKITNDLYNKRPGNVFLEDNLYKQVQIAYSVPRNISLITIAHHGLFNLFPTDLHGTIAEGFYIISLRHSGKAAQQAEMTRKIVICQVGSSFYKTVYALGKNHMQELKQKDQFPLTDRLSSNFGSPLPQHAVSYKELELIEFFDHGIHRVFLFKIVNAIVVETKTGALSHIHNAYATWRHNNRLSGNYLLR